MSVVPSPWASEGAMWQRWRAWRERVSREKFTNGRTRRMLIEEERSTPHSTLCVHTKINHFTHVAASDPSSSRASNSATN